MTEHFSPPQNHESTTPNSETLSGLPIDQLPESLGFIETEEMNKLHEGYLAAKVSRDDDATREFIAQYHLFGQKIVEIVTSRRFFVATNPSTDCA